MLQWGLLDHGEPLPAERGGGGHLRSAGVGRDDGVQRVRERDVQRDPCSGASTTVWDWLNQVNTAGFAGHTDWRLPSEAACNSCWSGPPTYTCSVA